MKLGIFKWIVLTSVLIALVLSPRLTRGMVAVFGERQQVEPGYAAFLLIGVVAFVMRDFMNFLSHLLQHRIPMLWEFHKVHHAATFLTPLTIERFHPVQFQFDALMEGTGFAVVLGVAGYAYSFNIVDMTALAMNIGFIANLVILAPLQHSNIPLSFGPLEAIVCSPVMHHIHHSALPQHHDKNFGSGLALWDRAFGTLYRPGRGEAVTLGLGEAEGADFDSLPKCLALPFVKVYRLIAGHFAAAR